MDGSSLAMDRQRDRPLSATRKHHHHHLRYPRPSQVFSQVRWPCSPQNSTHRHTYTRSPPLLLHVLLPVFFFFLPRRLIHLHNRSSASCVFWAFCIKFVGWLDDWREEGLRASLGWMTVWCIDCLASETEKGLSSSRFVALKSCVFSFFITSFNASLAAGERD